MDENLWVFFLGGVLPFPLGAVILPLIVIDGLGKDFLADAVIGYLVHALPPIVAAPFAGILGVLGFYSAFFGVISGFYAALFSVALSPTSPQAAGACLAIPLGLLCFSGTVLLAEIAFVAAVAVNNFWCTPVAVANSASRALYRAEAGGQEARLHLPRLPALATLPSPQMAY